MHKLDLAEITDSSIQVTGYSDSDWGRDPDTRRSISVRVQCTVRLYAIINITSVVSLQDIFV